jgi:uncharacterized protein (TIRG00374 family)
VQKKTELLAIQHVFSDALSWKLLIGLIFEFVSILCYSLTTWSLIPNRPRQITPPWTASLTLAATALGNSLPLGAGVSAYYGYSRLERMGASKTNAGLAIGATNAVATATLAFLAVLSTLLSSGGTRSALSGVTLVVLVVLVLVMVLLLFRIGPLAARVVFSAVYLRQRIRNSHNEALVDARAARDRIVGISYSTTTLLSAVAFSTLNWCWDFAALVLALWIAHAQVEPTGIVAAYFLGALAANLPITPGGLGVVEGSLAVALVAFGGKQVNVLTAVLLYRLVSFWFWLPVGWVMHFLLGAHLGRRERRLDGAVGTSSGLASAAQSDPLGSSCDA